MKNLYARTLAWFLKQIGLLVRIPEKAKNFKLERNALIFLLFFALSTLFWFLKALNDDYETILKYPVKYTNIPDEVILENELPDELEIKVRDKGFSLVQYKLSSSTFYLKGEINLNNIISLNKAKSSQQRVVLNANGLQKRIKRQLNVGTELLAVYPDTIPIIYSMDMEKKVAIIANVEIYPHKQCMISGKITTTPDSISIYGPASKLDTISAVYTTFADYEKVSDTLVRNIAIEKPKGIRLSRRRVVLTVPVEPFTEKTLQVPVVGLNFPDSLRLRTFPGKVEVSFFVGLSQYANIIAEDLRVEVPYNKIVNHSIGKAPIGFGNHNNLIKNPRLNTDSVEYLIELIN